MGKRTSLLSLLLLCLATGCKEMYTPPIIRSGNSYLIVEGVLNAGSGGTRIRLSRSSSIYGQGAIITVNTASVIVEGKDNTTRLLTPLGDGYYFSPNLNLVISNEYRLRILTFDNKEYLSDYVVALQTPPIDSIGWKRSSQGVQLYVNAHDPLAKTRYYRWDYDETWEIQSYYYSHYIYENNAVRLRTPPEIVFNCWKYASSQKILLASSARLQEDLIFEAPLLQIPERDEKISVRYSILLRQYAMPKEGYEFYELMKKNTESIGTIFDPQPSELRGNIRCISDPNEPVIGFISASTISEKRKFISNSELQDWSFPQDCYSFNVAPEDIHHAYTTGEFMPMYENYSPVTGLFIGYETAPSFCVDCRLRGGLLDKPSYW